MKPRLLLAFMVALTACSINVSDGPVATVPVHPTLTRPSALTAPPAESATPSEIEPTPLPWADLQLTGRLIYTRGAEGIAMFDPTTGSESILFQPPIQGWVTFASVSPDGQWMALAYAPPPPDNKPQLGYTDLYLLPTQCETTPEGCANVTPQALLTRTEQSEAYFAPFWTPDGAWLYFVHFTPSDESSKIPYSYNLKRVAFGEGQLQGEPETVVEHAIWPQLSPDGKQLVYVFQDPETYVNKLYVANMDGSEPQQVLSETIFEAVDAPMFTPDGKALVFSAVGEGPQTWWFGAKAASAATVYTWGFGPLAHNVPSDWWRMDLATNAITRLTRVYGTALFGAFSPDGRYLAYVSASGMYVMQPNGEGLTTLRSGGSNVGTLIWAP